jgi:hypothetical protein
MVNFIFDTPLSSYHSSIVPASMFQLSETFHSVKSRDIGVLADHARFAGY